MTMYFLEQQRKFTTPNILGGHSIPVATWRWKQVAVSENEEELRRFATRLIDERTKREKKERLTISKEYRIISNKGDEIQL